MTDVIITLQAGDDWAEVLSPFEAKNIIKSLPAPGRKWDPDERCWLIRAHLAGQLAGKLRDAGFTVSIIRPAAVPAARPDPGSWAELMYAAVGSDLGDRAYQALIRILHPDTGGDTAAMQSLNRARDRVRGKNTKE